MSRHYVVYIALRNRIPEKENPEKIAEQLRLDIVKKLHIPDKSAFVWNILDLDERKFLER